MEKTRSAAEWRGEADAHYGAGRWQEAARALESALALEPGSAESWYRLGNARQELGDDRRAVECFERLVGLDPAHARGWNNLGVSRQKLGFEATAADAYRQAIEHEPQLLNAVLNLAHIAVGQGDDAAAANLLERAAALDPENTDTLQSLALALVRIGRPEEANRAYQAAMQKLLPIVQPMLDRAEAARLRGANAEAEKLMLEAARYIPHNPLLAHMTAALRGEALPRASKGYVTALFDGFAQNYDRHMRENLQYRSPEHLARTVAPLLKAGARVVDLGCGTGLLGLALAHTGASITGIDLSSKMLEHARRCGAYARLVNGDFIEELERAAPASVDAIVSTDTFIYVGDLRPAFRAAARALAPDGILAFSTEALDEDRDFQLRTSGRYAHSSRYLRELAREAGLVEHSLVRMPARLEREKFVDAWLACFTRPLPAESRPLQAGAIALIASLLFTADALA